MTRFQRELNGSLGPFWQKEAEKELARVKADLDSGRITIDEAGVARNCIGRVLMADMLEKLSEVLEVPVSELLGKPSGAPEQASELEKISAQLAILNEQMAREMARRKRNRKIKIIIASVIFGLLFIFAAFILISHPVSSSIMSGDASNVRVLERQSSLYSQEEIESAIEVIKRDFENDWNGCTLNTIYYAGDEVCADETRDRGVKTIVLISDFTTGNYDFGSLNTNYTYTNWSWILIRDEDGGWKHIDHGYG